MPRRYVRRLPFTLNDLKRDVARGVRHYCENNGINHDWFVQNETYREKHERETRERLAEKRAKDRPDADATDSTTC